MRFAAIGLDHRHIYHLVEGLLDAGLSCAGYWPQTSDPLVLKGFRERFPDLVAVEDRDALMHDPSVGIICCAAIPRDRADIAIEAMRHRKDVMVDKPGVITADAFEQVQQAVRETGRIFSICFSERLTVPASEVAGKLIADGAIGRVIQTVGLGPHRFNRAIRPAWFFDPVPGGGILVDIASHQIEQFMFYTGSDSPEIVASTVGKFGTADFPEFQDFGEILLRSERASGYVRSTGSRRRLPSWGDGRSPSSAPTDISSYAKSRHRRPPGTDHLFMADHRGTRYIDCSKEPLSYLTALRGRARPHRNGVDPGPCVHGVPSVARGAGARGAIGSHPPSR